MILGPECLAHVEAGAAPSRTVLLKDPVDVSANQFAEKKIRCIISVCDENLASLEGIEHAPQQALLVAPLPLQGPMLAFSTAPVVRHVRATTRHRGNPKPGFWFFSCGYFA